MRRVQGQVRNGPHSGDHFLLHLQWQSLVLLRLDISTWDIIPRLISVGNLGTRCCHGKKLRDPVILYVAGEVIVEEVGRIADGGIVGIDKVTLVHPSIQYRSRIMAKLN